MVLKMPRPFKHPKTGSFYLRVRIPEDLKAAFGKTEFKKSLATKDAKTAAERHVAEYKKFLRKCENLRRGPTGLSQSAAHRLAQPIFEKWLRRFQDDPNAQAAWKSNLFGDLWRDVTDRSDRVAPNFVVSPNGSVSHGSEGGCPEVWDHVLHPARRQEKLCAAEAKQLMADEGLSLDDESIAMLEKAIGAAIQRAALHLHRLASGEIAIEEFSISQAPAAPARGNALTDKPLPFSEVFEGWKAEAEPKAKTAYEWRRIFKIFIEFSGVDDLRLLCPANVLAWKDSLVASGLAAKTINDSKLSAIRTILAWAVYRGRLASNPALGIRARQRMRAGGKRGFSDGEASVVLKAARGEKRPELRWMPLLMAYSGARVAEVAQLRREDIRRDDAIPTMRFDPAAGSLKTKGSERTVPLHPAILEEGFLEFVQNAPEGPLFTGLRTGRYGNRGDTATKVLGPWVRSLGVSDGRLSPNHSWRHRFKTKARNYGLVEEMTDAILGHHNKSVGQGYGDREIPDLFREIAKIPKIIS